MAAHEPGEQELGGVAAAQARVLVTAREDRLSALEGRQLDQRLVLALVQLAVPADHAEIRGVGEDPL
ncbi:MAG TPA: hypothetical protein VHS55_05725 [Solirubrobacteraceae bacterium]|nr:hypothetical protein [Solirubrobacteraceae bacterium]